MPQITFNFQPILETLTGILFSFPLQQAGLLLLTECLETAHKKLQASFDITYMTQGFLPIPERSELYGIAQTLPYDLDEVSDKL
ncbi:MAG: hypothetical protein ACLQQ4_06915 [Bacteroidia bacterium]